MEALSAENENLPHHIQSSIDRLRSYKSPTPEHSIASIPESFADLPTPRFAAVLVILYHLPDQGLRVLLTTRSKELRSHPGQSALPGGKSDPDDVTPLGTALREAFEEITLPIAPENPLSQYIQFLTLLPPHLSLFRIIVTPVVVFCSRPDLVLPSLKANEAEVAAIFDHPLEALLDPSIMQKQGECLADPGEDWPYADELHNTSDISWLSGQMYRMHRFRSNATPVKGLTADILILVAQIAFDRTEPTYPRWAPLQCQDPEATILWAAAEARKTGSWTTGRLMPSSAPALPQLQRTREDEDLGPYTPSTGTTPRASTPSPTAI